MTDIAQFINRVKNLEEFTVITEVPDGFRFNGLVPYDITISKGYINAKVWAINFDEAVTRFNELGLVALVLIFTLQVSGIIKTEIIP